MAETLDRRRFLTLAAGSVAVGALMVLHGCSGGSDSSTTPTPNPTFTDKNGSISSNHGHSVTLTAAQQQEGADVTLTLSAGTIGGGTHTHLLGLRAADVAAVAAGSRMSVETSVTAGHSHTVLFS